MSESGTYSSLVAAGAQRRPDARRVAPEAAFLSQLIAERHHLAPQRSERRAPLSQAVDAYATGSSISVVRLPAGYRRTVVA